MGSPASERTERLISAEEYAQLPEEHEYRVELVRGRLVREPRPATLHARLVARLTRLLDEFVERSGGGLILTEGGALLARDPDTVRGPDIAFYSRDRIPAARYELTYWEAPDLAVEITSPSNRAPDIQEKVTDYLDAGARLVWVVDPRTRTVTAYAHGGTARIVRSDQVLEGDEVLPGFRLSLAQLFAL
jgi:Uma2 family endonuclease